jgi:hypothetical protein
MTKQELINKLSSFDKEELERVFMLSQVFISEIQNIALDNNIENEATQKEISARQILHIWTSTLKEDLESLKQN